MGENNASIRGIMPKISILECLVMVIGDMRTPFGATSTWLKLHGIEHPSNEELNYFKKKVFFKAIMGFSLALAIGTALIVMEIYLRLPPFR